MNINEKSLPVFTMLPPFWDSPLYDKPSKYLNRIKEEFDIDIQTYSYQKSAFDHDVFIINKELVFRFPRTESVRNHLKDEIAFLNFLKNKVNIEIPNYNYISDNKDFAGYPIINGQILSPSAFKVLNKKNKEKVINSLIGFVNTFHQMKEADFMQFKPRKRLDFIEDEKRIEQELKKTLFPIITKQEIEAIEEFYKTSKKYLENLPRVCPIHGDLYAYNVIWNKQNSKTSVIDFTDYLIGDPAKDFEVFYDYGVDFVQMAYEKYDGEKDKDFLSRAEMYYKVHSIYTLLSSLCGALISFEYARDRFRKKFQL